MKLISREAELKDAECIANLSTQLGYGSTIEEIRTRLSDVLNHADHCVYVIIDNEDIIGWIHGFYALRVESDSFVEIGGMVVDEKYRRKGVGKMLVENVVEWSRLKTMHKIRVRCNTQRIETHMFYKSIGFVETKEQKILDMKLVY
jgi:GNAT superfamily N-acetyltransferase